MSEERTKILEMVQSGRITAEEAADLLKLVSSEERTEPGDKATPAHVESEHEQTWKPHSYYWQYPLLAGLILVLVGGTVVTSAYQRGRIQLGTWICGWVPLLVGLTVATVAAWARTARWIHLQVENPNHRIALGLPLPLGLMAWVLGVARTFWPPLQNSGVDEAILALRDELKGSEPVTLEVSDDEDGEHVVIRLG